MNSQTTLKLSLLLLLLQFLFVKFVQAQSLNSSDSVKAVREALQMISFPDPSFKNAFSPPQDARAIADMGLEQVYEWEAVSFKMKDGGILFGRKYVANAKTTIVLLHGALSNGYYYNRMSGLLRTAGGAEVFSLDLRGHGQSSGKAGDVDYIGQYEDDLIEVVRAVKKEKPGNKIILAGHSMGGGIILRFAQRKDRPAVDGYLLFAPNLAHNSPAMRKASVTDEQSGEPFLKIHIPRSVGLHMLNQYGIHEYDSLHVMFYNLPDEVPLKNYTYRSTVSMAPDSFKDGLRAVDKPLLVIVGSEDEAFISAEYEPPVKAYTKGEVLVVDGATHNGIRHEKQAMTVISSWAKSYNFTE